MQLTGVHHLTAVTAEASRNHAFYTQVLGLRLVKKSVNQDDVSAYHLFYADGKATPGTDLTFFDWPAAREGRGTHSIVSTGLRVRREADLAWWRERLAAKGVVCGPEQVRGGRPCLPFEDFEGQRLCLTVDASPGETHPWAGSDVPAERQILGLGPITLSVPSLAPTERVLTAVMNFRAGPTYRSPDSRGGVVERDVHVFATGAGGPAAEVHVMLEPDLLPARSGVGGVHHVAFRVPDESQYRAWAERLSAAGLRHSGPVDRYYFRSLYFREPNGILFELATDGPGFAVDEPMETLGERLALPPFLEHRRKEIEAGLKPL